MSHFICRFISTSLSNSITVLLDSIVGPILKAEQNWLLTKSNWSLTLLYKERRICVYKQEETDVNDIFSGTESKLIKSDLDDFNGYQTMGPHRYEDSILWMLNMNVNKMWYCKYILWIWLYIYVREMKRVLLHKREVQKIFFENKKGIDPSAHSVYFTQIKSFYYQRW